ncbi:LOW QUALITY PROTEIN: putative transporter SVOPL [Plodia interpunctella]|uniref:LOW QUALITY PROTEIN: putative transporter SVOPL n=1 Tax=Plodia interpunctella TaxID=58824 RepID=UPI002368C4F4|nr:LOW QUALITY PROTEIN: putative transporter SVOPL [Plodia interpunctella]
MSDVESKDIDNYHYDEAVELTGHGWYNRWLLVASSIISMAAALDMFGFTIVVASATCDLQLGLKETGLLASAPFVGVIFAFPWGYYADTRGRWQALMVSTSGGFLMAVLTSLAPTWEVMLVLKILSCSFSSVSYTLTMTYVGEAVSSRHRGRYLFILTGMNLLTEFVSFGLAYLILPLDFRIPITWLSITFRPWRLFTMVMAVPLGLGMLSLVFLQESPKFLADKGENDKALAVLRIMYEANGGNGIEYPVKQLKIDPSNQTSPTFWRSIVDQTIPIFKPPFLWTTLKLYFLMTICGSTNNVFLMWMGYPMIVNMFFNALADGSNAGASLCQSIAQKLSTSTNVRHLTCDDTISPYTLYSGMIYGIFFCILTLLVAQVAVHRRLVLIATFSIAAASGILLNVVTQPIAVMVFFTLLQGTTVGIGSVASYFTDLYPTSYRGLVTSMSMMFARFASMAGVNLIGATIFHHCAATFYGWSAFVLSGVAVSMLIPKDKVK